jgi:hypothetical protein
MSAGPFDQRRWAPAAEISPLGQGCFQIYLHSSKFVDRFAGNAMTEKLCGKQAGCLLRFRFKVGQKADSEAFINKFVE